MVAKISQDIETMRITHGKAELESAEFNREASEYKELFQTELGYNETRLKMLDPKIERQVWGRRKV